MLEKLFEFINAHTNSIWSVLFQLGVFFALVTFIGVQSIKGVKDQRKQNTILGIILGIAMALLILFLIGITGVNN